MFNWITNGWNRVFFVRISRSSTGVEQNDEIW
jgi:hypothetical protein